MTLEGQVDTGRTTHLPQMHRQVPWKTWVRIATTANGTLASAFDNGSTVDGVALATGDRILLKNQTATEENGIYVVQASGVPLRAFDMDDPEEVEGAVVLVLAGTANAGTIWYTTSTPSVLDDDAIVWTQFTGTGGVDLTGINFLVGTATGLLSAEIAVGTTPGGELGNTWASPTVDTTHSGSAHTDFIAKSLLTTQDDIIVRDGTGPARLAKGTDGQVLTVDPTTHHLVWATPTSGGISGIDVKEGGSTVVASATALDFLNGLDVAAPGGGVASVVVDPSEIKLDDLGTPDDNTDLDATTGVHGLLRKLGGGTTNFLRADGSWADPSVPAGTSFNEAIYGDGHDSNVTISVDTTLTRDMFYNNLTINSGITLNTALLRVFVKGTLTLSGTIACNGNNGGNGGTGTAVAGGAAGAAGTQQAGGANTNLPNGTVGRAGAIGGINANGTGTTAGGDTTYGFANVPAGKAGGISGSGRSGGGGGAVGTSTETVQEQPLYWPNVITWRSSGATLINLATVTGVAAQAGSGGGAAASGGGGSGGSGSGGGVVVVVAKAITGNGVIRAKGGNGGNGGNGLAAAQAGGGAGGNGGQGGIVVLIYSDNSGWTGTLDVAGGTHGNKGTAGGGAGSTDGQDGNDGNAGKAITYRIS